MPSIGRNKLNSGVTTHKRVEFSDRNIFAKLSGYEYKNGVLTGEDMVGLLNTGTSQAVIGDNPVPEQMPFAFRDGDSTIIVARDKSNKIREFESNNWQIVTGAPALADVPVDAIPIRVGQDQIVFPTQGSTAQLHVYEPRAKAIRVANMTGAAGGTGYTVGDVLTLSGGTNGTVTVATISGGGATGPVASVTLTNGGYGYTVGVQTTTGGTGAGDCTVNVATVGGLLRPNSFKSPADYLADEKPSATASTNAGIQLWDNDTSTNLWTTSADTKYTVDNATVDKSVFSFEADGVAGTAKAFTKSLGDTGIDPTGKSYFVMSIMIQDDTQTYTDSGLFPNDSSLMPSGYTLAFYSDTGCSALIKQVHIPKCSQNGLVYRIAIATNNMTTTIKGIALGTASFWTAPTGVNIKKVTMWSEAFKDDWSHKGNFLMPPIKWNEGAFADILSTVSDEEVNAPNLSNLVSNPGFESALSGTWTVSDSSRVERTSEYKRSGSYGVIFHSSTADDDYLETVLTDTAAKTPYQVSLWYRAPTSSVEGRSFKVTVTHYDSGDNALASETFPSSGWYSVGSVTTWKEKRIQLANPTHASTSYTKIKIIADNSFYKALCIDDVSMVSLDTSSANDAWIMQTFSQSGGNQDPPNPYVRWAYAFRGIDRLSAYVYTPLISNPSNESAPSMFADPWRTYDLSIALPDDSLGNNVIDDYGNYVTHVLIYRQIYDGATDTWSPWTYINNAAIATSITYTDDANDDATQMIDGYAVPLIMETRNDIGTSARHLVYLGQRLYAFHLDWVQTDGEWRRRLWCGVSSQGKPWVFPTSVDSDSLVTDGSEIVCEAVTGSEIRGAIAVGDDIYVFLDTEYFILRGDNPLTGWRWIRIDAIGLMDARTLANCRGTVIGLGVDYNFYGFTSGGAVLLSEDQLDAQVVLDLTKPHNAIFFKDEYILFNNSRLVKFNLPKSQWRVRECLVTDHALINCVGICTDGSTAYGLANLTAGATLLSLFDSTATTDGGQTALREIWTQYIQVANHGADAQVHKLIVEAEGIDSQTVTVAAAIYGMVADGSVSTKQSSFTTSASKTRYEVNLGVIGTAVKIRLSYSGSNPPDIHCAYLEPGGTGR